MADVVITPYPQYLIYTFYFKRHVFQVLFYHETFGFIVDALLENRNVSRRVYVIALAHHCTLLKPLKLETSVFNRLQYANAILKSTDNIESKGG